jgi:anti-anti-sigma factor
LDSGARNEGNGEVAVTRHELLGELGGLRTAELKPAGTLDIESADDFRDMVGDLLDGGTLRFLVDLGGVTYVDSTGLGSLMHLYRTARERGGAVHLYALTPAVQDIFSLTHLDKVVEIRASRAEVLASIEA